MELVRRLGVLEGLEGIAYETDLRGTAIGSAPIADLKAVATQAHPGPDDGAKVDAFVAKRLRNFTEFLQGLVKTPEKLQWQLLDSSPYANADGSQISQLRKWGIELLKGDSNGVAEVASAIGRVQLEIARVLGIEHAMVGGNDSAGSFGMHQSKLDAHALMLQTTLTEIAGFATNDLARVLVALNGLDPETCTPILVAEPISTDAVAETCRALSLLATAALQPDDPALPVLRKRMRLPAPPEPDAAMMGLLGGPPDPKLGEKVDDLGAQPTKPGRGAKPSPHPTSNP